MHIHTKKEKKMLWPDREQVLCTVETVSACIRSTAPHRSTFRFFASMNCIRKLSRNLQTPDEYRKLLGYRSLQWSSMSGAARRSQRSVVRPPAMPVYTNTVDVNQLPTCVNWTHRGWVGPVRKQVANSYSIDLHTQRQNEDIFFNDESHWHLLSKALQRCFPMSCI